MRIVGYIATAVFAGLLLVCVAVILLSLPDIARYRRLRRM